MSHCCSFFFSSRRRHTRSDRDWSSDVCSSDLPEIGRSSFILPAFRKRLSASLSNSSLNGTCGSLIPSLGPGVHFLQPELQGVTRLELRLIPGTLQWPGRGSKRCLHLTEPDN